MAPAGSYSQGNYTTQINTNGGFYMKPDGSWIHLSDATEADMSAIHHPAGN